MQHVAVPFAAARSTSPCPSRLHAPRRRAPFAGLPSALDQTHMGSYVLMLNSSQVVSLLFYLEYICISQTFASGAHAPVPYTLPSSITRSLPGLYHVVSISPPRFFPRSRRPGSETGLQKTSIGDILESQVSNLGAGRSPRIQFFKVSLFRLF